MIDEKVLDVFLKERETKSKEMSERRKKERSVSSPSPIANDRVKGRFPTSKDVEEKYVDLTSRYYCPNCGNKLKYENAEEALREYKEVEVKLNEYLTDTQRRPISLECTGEDCYMKDGVYWTLHHPESDERPCGDSFSISYIK